MSLDPVFEALSIDVQRTRRRLPRELACLADVVWNMAWSWLPDGASLFREIDVNLWNATKGNARAVLEETAPQRLMELATDPAFVRRAEALAADLETYMARPQSSAAERVQARYEGRPVAYFCAEFGVHESIPIYSGGLGILAGDHLKSASDLGMPLLAIGLRYKQGYFHQKLDRSGWQSEEYRDTPFGKLPVGLLLRPDGTPITVSVPFRDRQVTLQLWGVRVGKIPLILLDSDREDNDPIDRWITGHLYGGNKDTRLAQEMVLGIGGVRALRALGYRPSVFHMNEGHAAFLGLELIREGLDRGQLWEEAVNATREQTVFTTHTPVPAGHDTFPQEKIQTFMSDYLEEFRGSSFEVPREKVMLLGRKRAEDAYEEYGMTPLAIHTSRKVNGVSRLHGEVCRDMLQAMWPGKAVADVPIGSVTNGIHAPTWVSPLLRDLFNRYLGADWEQRQCDPATWAKVDDIPDAELWDVHCRMKRRLVQQVRARTKQTRLQNQEPEEYIRAAERVLDPDALTLGFARRVATYKRLDLLLYDVERALRLLNLPGRPVQLVLAGKAHPGDSEAKRLVQQLFRIKYDSRLVRQAVYLVDYEISIAREMVQAVDVWLNVPRRPLEASGTSGMKAALNGIPNCSILDGWWAEGYNGKNGWAIGQARDYTDASEQNRDDALSLYSTLEEQIVPLYYDRDARGIPRGWVAMMKESLKSCGPVFNTDRMVSEYATEVYAPRGA